MGLKHKQRTPPPRYPRSASGNLMGSFVVSVVKGRKIFKNRSAFADVTPTQLWVPSPLRTRVCHSASRSPLVCGGDFEILGRVGAVESRCAGVSVAAGELGVIWPLARGRDDVTSLGGNTFYLGRGYRLTSFSAQRVEPCWTEGVRGFFASPPPPRRQPRSEIQGDRKLFAHDERGN